jgi:hypothetical protein
MATRSPFFFAVSRELVEKMPQSCLLDMLRYDGAHPVKVESGYWIFGCKHTPTVDHWASFGVPVFKVGRSLYDVASDVRSRG